MDAPRQLLAACGRLVDFPVFFPVIFVVFFLVFHWFSLVNLRNVQTLGEI